MTDISTTIAPKSDQLNADDLIGGRTMTIKVTRVSLLGEAEQPIAVNFEGDNGKPYKPCKSMRRVMVSVWGHDGNSYIGRRMKLYRDDKVKFGGADVGGIRISHMSDISSPVTMALTASKAQRKPYTVRPLEDGAAPTTDQLKTAGEKAAKGGMSAYKDWFNSLTIEAKNSIKSHHEGWKKIASNADAAALDDGDPQPDPQHKPTGKKALEPSCIICQGRGVIEDESGKGPCTLCGPNVKSEPIPV